MKKKPINTTLSKLCEPGVPDGKKDIVNKIKCCQIDQEIVREQRLYGTRDEKREKMSRNKNTRDMNI